MGLISRVSSRTYRSFSSKSPPPDQKPIILRKLAPRLLNRTFSTSPKKMVLDIEFFRPEAGGDPEKIRANQKKRFKNEGLVDIVVENDKLWRRSQFLLDNCNKVKNICSKAVGERMKAKKPQGDTETLPEGFLPALPESGEFTDEFVAKLSDLKKEDLSSDDLCTKQIKTIKTFVDKAITWCKEQAVEQSKKRDSALRECANFTHDTVPVSNNEDKDNKIERT